MSCPTIQTIIDTECIGASLPKINNNYEALRVGVCDNQDQINNLTTRVNTVSSNLASILTLPGTVIQSSYVCLTAGDILRENTTISEVTQIPAVTIASRKQSTSDIKIELEGGHPWAQFGGSGYRTWFYVSENDGPYQIPVTGGTGNISNTVEIKWFASASDSLPHDATLVYKPGPLVTKISVKVFAAGIPPSGGGANNMYWNIVSVPGGNSGRQATIPFFFSISEIKV